MAHVRSEVSGWHSSLLSVNTIGFETMIANQGIANRPPDRKHSLPEPRLAVASFIVSDGEFPWIIIIVLKKQSGNCHLSTPGSNERSFITLFSRTRIGLYFEVK